MADARPFRGLYFDRHVSGGLEKLVCPPAPRIDDARQQDLEDRSPWNAVRLVRGRALPGDSREQNRFMRARRALLDWQKEGVLKRETDPTYYLYEQELSGGGAGRRSLWGVVPIPSRQEGGTATSWDGVHLMMACHTSFSPALIVVEDGDEALFDLLDRLHYDADDLRGEWRDRDGVLQSFKAVNGAHYAAEVSAALAGKGQRLVEGHEEVAAAAALRDWARRENPDFGPESPECFVLAALASSKGALLGGPLEPPLLSGLVFNKIDDLTL